MRYLGPPPPAAEQLARYRESLDHNGFGIWAVEERASGRFVGRAGLHRHRLWPTEIECGWSLDSAFWGRGYATEAGAAAMRHAFEALEAPRVISIVHPQNAPSIRVAERLGERPYATVPWDDTGIDLLVYAIERDEWRRLQSSG